MTPEDVLAIPPSVLTDKQRQFYFENGYLIVEGLLSDEKLPLSDKKKGSQISL